MAKIPDRVITLIKQLKFELSNNKIPIKDIYLFGSYAKGDYNNFSDIDLLLISPLFKGNLIEDKNLIRKYVLKVSSELEIYPCSEKMLKENNPFIQEIIKNGIKIEAKNE